MSEMNREAEQASGDTLEVLREFAEDYRRYIPQFHAQNRKRMKRNLADLDAAIAALSQRPVVDEAMVERALRAYECAAESQGFTPADARERITAYQWMRDALTAALAPQQPTGDGK